VSLASPIQDRRHIVARFLEEKRAGVLEHACAAERIDTIVSLWPRMRTRLSESRKRAGACCLAPPIGRQAITGELDDMNVECVAAFDICVDLCRTGWREAS
jgi:hypothetical protein